MSELPDFMEKQMTFTWDDLKKLVGFLTDAVGTIGGKFRFPNEEVEKLCGEADQVILALRDRLIDLFPTPEALDKKDQLTELRALRDGAVEIDEHDFAKEEIFKVHTGAENMFNDPQVVRSTYLSRIIQESKDLSRLSHIGQYIPRKCVKECPMLEEPKFLATGEAAKKLGVSDQTILNWIEAGKLRAEKTLGGHYRVYADQFKTTAEQDQAFDEFFERIHKKYEHLGPVDENEF